MPNWMNGSLKVRGPLENVKRFFMEGLSYPREIDEPRQSVPFHIDDNHRVLELYTDDSEWLYVDDTNRAFINPQQYSILIIPVDAAAKNYIGVAEINQAWGFNEEEWVELSKKYGVDIRLWGLEGGMSFGQVIEIINGELTLDESTSYDTWTNPLPWIGG